MNIDNPKLIKQLESLVDNRQDWLFRFAYIRIGQREDAEDIVQEVLLRNLHKHTIGYATDSGNLITLNISWRINQGSKHKSAEKRINLSDTDNGIMK